MTAEILIKFARKGIILSPEAYQLIASSDNPLNLSSEIIVKLKSGNYSNDMVPVDVNTLKNMEGLNLKLGREVQETKTPQQKEEIKPLEEKPKQPTIEKPQSIEDKKATTMETKPLDSEKPSIETKPIEEKQGTIETKPKEIEKPVEEKPQPSIETKPKEKPKNPGYASEHVVKIEDAEVSEDTKLKYKRNLTESKVNFDKYKVLKDTSNKSYTSGEIGNLIEYFQNRYKKLSGILSKRPELRIWQKINEITEDQTDLNLIVMITDIRSTKNGHYLIEVEDDTGSLPILVSKDNDELLRAAKNLMKDEVIGVIAQKRAGQSENQLAICQNLIDPGVPRMPRKEVDFGTVFTSDIHIGSVTFLEDAFVRFTRWLNGDFGNEQQREMANNVKYMIVGGDIVDGISFDNNNDYGCFAQEFLLLGSSDDCDHLGPHQRGSHYKIELLCIVIREVSGEHAVNLAPS